LAGNPHYLKTSLCGCFDAYIQNNLIYIVLIFLNMYPAFLDFWQLEVITWQALCLGMGLVGLVGLVGLSGLSGLSHKRDN